MYNRTNLSLFVGFEKHKSIKLLKKYKLHKRTLYHAVLVEQQKKLHHHTLSSSSSSEEEEEVRMLNFDRLAILSNRISQWAVDQALCGCVIVRTRCYYFIKRERIGKKGEERLDK
jgi:hypothetical protein